MCRLFYFWEEMKSPDERVHRGWKCMGTLLCFPYKYVNEVIIWDCCIHINSTIIWYYLLTVGVNWGRGEEEAGGWDQNYLTKQYVFVLQWCLKFQVLKTIQSAYILQNWTAWSQIEMLPLGFISLRLKMKKRIFPFSSPVIIWTIILCVRFATCLILTVA